MARYKKIHVTMYADAKYLDLSRPQPNGQSLWCYLLTGPHTTAVPGLSVAGEAGLAEAMGWSTEGFRKAFAEVSAKGMAEADWKARVVWVPKSIKYNPPESPNVIKGWGKQWDEIPECALKVVAFNTLKAFVEGMHEDFAKAFREACRHPLPNQEQEQYQEPKEESGVNAAARDEDPGPEPTPTRSPKAGGNGKRRSEAAGDHAELIRHFRSEWKARYGTDYEFDRGKDGAHVKRILEKSKGDLAKAKLIVAAFLRDDDPKVAQKKHPLGWILSGFNQYQPDASNGQARTLTEARIYDT